MDTSKTISAPIPFTHNGWKIVEEFNGLGFHYQPMPGGMQVTGVASGSVAEEVLRVGDLITHRKNGDSWESVTTNTPGTVKNLRGDLCQPVTFRLIRNGEMVESTVYRQHFRNVEDSAKTKHLILDPNTPDCMTVSDAEMGKLTAPTFFISMKDDSVTRA